MDVKVAHYSAPGGETAPGSRRRLRVAVFIDHDIFVRHFLHSGVLRDLFARHEVDVIVPPEGHKRLSVDPAPYVAGARLHRLPPNPDRHRLWARLLQVTCMRPRLDAVSLELRRMWRLALTAKAEILYTAVGAPGIYAAFRRWTLARVARIENPALDALMANRHDLVLIPGTPDSPFSQDILYECNRRGVPCVMIMNSWDNPSGNRLVSGMPDLYLVWGEQTRRHAIEYLGIPPQRALAFGAAQFDHYRLPPRIDRRAFAERHGIDPGRRMLLYAGGSLGTDEFADLAVLDAAIESGAIANATVLYRPHPWGGDVDRARRILQAGWRHVVIESTTRAYLERLCERGYHIMLADTRDTHDVLASIDAIVSPMSTILVEAMLHGKPTLCYLPLDDVEARHFQAVHQLTHFRDVQTSPHVVLARSRAELVPAIRGLLAQSDDLAVARRLEDLGAHFVARFDRSYGERLVELVQRFAAGRTERAG